jgi:uncharacterized damage-inducible protein DinB
MNSYMQERWSWVEGTHAMRKQLLDSLTDADLSFNPGGQNLTLGGLCREIGDIQHSYVQSLKQFQQDWGYRNTDVGVETSVEKLKAWFQALDDDMKATLERMSEDDLQKVINRGGGFEVPVAMQMDIYLQALLIFFGKAVVYLRAMNKDLPGQIGQWIG